MFKVSLKRNAPKKVSVSIGGVQVPAQFSDLVDFDVTDLQGNNLVIYDATTGKYKTLPIDSILQKSVDDNSLPEEFIEQISQDVDLDAGEF